MNSPLTQTQAQLIGTLIGLIRSVDAAQEIPEQVQLLVQQGLAASVFSDRAHLPQQAELLRQIHAEKFRLVPDCSVCPNPCGRHDDYDMQTLWSAPKDIRSLKLRLLALLQVLSVRHPEQKALLLPALFQIGETIDPEELLPYVAEIEALI